MPSYKISELTEATSLQPTDLIEISQDNGGGTYYSKKVQVANIGPSLTGVTDANAIHGDVSGEISALPVKATPVATDLLLIEDSENGNAKASMNLAAMVSAVTPYFSGISPSVQTTTSTTYTDVTNGSFTWSLLSGTYLVNAHGEISVDSANRTTSLRLVVSQPSATWTRSGATITVTSASHNMVTGHRIAVTVSSNLTTIPLGDYTITYIDQDTYSFTGVASGGTSGTLEYNFIAFENQIRSPVASIFINLGGNCLLTTPSNSRTFSLEWSTSGGTASGRYFMILVTKLGN